MEPLGRVVSGTLARLGRHEELREPRAVVAWEAVVGPRVAAHSRAERLRRGELTVTVDGAAWLSELSFLKGEILEKLNACLGEPLVRSLRFVPGTVVPPAASTTETPPARRRRAAAPPPRQPSPDADDRSAETLDALEDPELRAAARALRRKLLGHDGG